MEEFILSLKVIKFDLNFSRDFDEGLFVWKKSD